MPQNSDRRGCYPNSTWRLCNNAQFMPTPDVDFPLLSYMIMPILCHVFSMNNIIVYCIHASDKKRHAFQKPNDVGWDDEDSTEQDERANADPEAALLARIMAKLNEEG
jgi:hypothetical protein